jgi:pimeloyl-[acyl-carrier protein] methyl ester esterase
MRAEAIAYHGWGFDRHCWRDWQVALAAQEIDLQCTDQGYFGAPLSWSFKTDAPKLLLAHSFGLHHITQEQLAMAEGLVIFAGFLTFHPSSSPQHDLSVAALTTLQENFQQQPALSLAAFRQQCFRPQSDPFELPQRLHPERLSTDLAQLHSHPLNVAAVRQVPHILWLQGRLDRIVPLSVGQQLFQALPQATGQELPRSGHGFPFTETQLCLDQIFGWLSRWCP